MAYTDEDLERMKISLGLDKRPYGTLSKDGEEIVYVTLMVDKDELGLMFDEIYYKMIENNEIYFFDEDEETRLVLDELKEFSKSQEVYKAKTKENIPEVIMQIPYIFIELDNFEQVNDKKISDFSEYLAETGWYSLKFYFDLDRGVMTLISKDDLK